MQLSLQQGQLAVDLQGDDPGQRLVYQLELLVSSPRLLHQGLEGELVAVDLIEQRAQQAGAGGGEA
ncbi:hypothetical protein D3C80_1267580 [compost metagenome]